jgi:predicted secreted protein
MKQSAVWVLLSLQLILSPPVASADEAVIEDQVSFQVEVGREVDNDRVVALLNVTTEDRDPAKVAKQINDTMGWALAQLSDKKVIRPRSGGYQTYPVYDDKKIVRWRGRQELQLESGDVNRLSQLIGGLQVRLQLQSLQFSVSADKRRDVESALIEEALAAFQQRAELIRKSLGAGAYRLMDMTVHTGGVPRPVPLQVEARASAAHVGVSSPAMEQGTTRVTVQASGRIHLLRD